MPAAASRSIRSPTPTAETVATATPPASVIETRIASDRNDEPWVYYHHRDGSNDTAYLVRVMGASWQPTSVPWGDPWQPRIVVDAANVAHVFTFIEGSNQNPEHATATSLANIGGMSAVGNWPWSHLLWRDSVAGEHACLYTPLTVCNDVRCAFDEACVAGACTPR